MLIERFADAWEITVPAKLNPFLEVLGRRLDGYHELDTIMVAVSLCDRIRIEATAGREIEFSVQPMLEDGFAKLTHEDQAWEVPNDASNLVVRAVNDLRMRWKIEHGLKIQLFKGIPSQAGLGGGSADAAGAIVGSMLAWRNVYEAKTAGEIAASLGSDINFFLEGVPEGPSPKSWVARCVGRGEIVEPIASSHRIDFIVLHPPQGCSTKKIFERISEEFKLGGELSRFAKFENRKDIGVTSNWSRQLFNRLQKPASRDNPWIERLVANLMDDAAVRGASMTGSGSAVFGIVDSLAGAQALANRLSRELKVRAYAVSSWQTPSIREQLPLNYIA